MSINRGRDKYVVQKYKGILLNHKKEWKNAIPSNMDGSRDCHPKWSKSDKDKYIPHMCNLILKSDKMYLFTKQKELQILKTILQLLKGKYSEGGIKQELGMNLHTPLCIK